ncbi:MAG: class I SAM-dependent methyltransferase [Clostridia bacterium]|nr:class I SAM-dependent methyltransferase [Clostridia bacterium]
MSIKYNDELEDWYDVYKNQIDKSGGNKSYMEFKIKHKKKLIKILKKECNNGKILEIGSGTGIVCSKLASEGFEVTGIDVNEDIINLAKELEKEYFGERKVKYIKKSMFELDFKEKEFELAYSVGVLEHFADNMIMDTIKQQLMVAKKIIIVIPTKWFDDDETLHGDDRFLTLKHWRNMISKSGGKVIKEYSYPFKQKYYQRIKNIRKIFRPKAYRVFLVEER